MFFRLGRGVVRHPWLVIGIWIVAAVAIVGLAPKLASSSSESSFLPSHYQSVQAQNLQQSAFPTAAAPGAIVVFERADGGQLTAADSHLVDGIAGKLAADDIPTMGTMQAGPPSANKLIQTISVQIPNVSGQLTTAQTNAIGTLRSDLSSLVSGTDLKAGVTGTVAEDVDSASTGNNAQKIVFIGTILLIIVLLLLIFRSPIIVLLPLLTIGLVSSVANGLIDFLSKALGWSAESFTSILLIVVLFGVGTDYILFLLFRYRERLRAGEPSKQAMESAIARVGPAIATAAGAVMIAFLALTLSSLSLFRELGPALAIAVFSAATAGLTLVPAVVSLLGTRVFWPSKAWKTEPKAARFAAIGRSLGRHPGRFAGTIVVLLGVLGIVAFGFHPTFDLTSGNTATTQSAQYANVLLKGFPAGDSEPTAVLVQSTDGKPLDTAALAPFGARLAKVPGVASVSPVKVNASGDVADYTVILSSSGESAAAMNTVRGPLGTIASTDAPPGSRALIGGITSVYVDLRVGDGARLLDRVPGRRGADPDHPRAAAAERGRALVPDALRRPRLRRHPGLHGRHLPGPRQPERPVLHPADHDVPVRGGARHRLQHPDGVAPAGGGDRGQDPEGGGGRGAQARRADDRLGRADPGRDLRLADPGGRVHVRADGLRDLVRHRDRGVRDGDVPDAIGDRAARRPGVVARAPEPAAATAARSRQAPGDDLPSGLDAASGARA